MENPLPALLPLFGILAAAMLAEALGDAIGNCGKAVRYLCALTVILLLARPLPALFGKLPTLTEWEEASPYSEDAAAEALLPRLEKALTEELTDALARDYALSPEDFSLAISLSAGEDGIVPRQLTLTLFTLRAVSRTDELREALAEFGCPVEIREQLLTGKETP